MKGKHLSIVLLTILLAIAVACNNNNQNGENKYESRLIVKANVTLLSGETEPLVNSEFYLLDYSLLEKMRLIESNVRNEYDLGGLEEAIRQEINYYPQVDALQKKIDNALDYYNNTMSRSKEAIKNLEARERNLLTAVKTPFSNYIKAAYTNSQEQNRKLRELASKRDWDSTYYFFLNESRKAQSLSGQAKSAFDNLQQNIDKYQGQFNQIQKQVVGHKRTVKTLPDETTRRLDRWRGEIDKLRQQVNERTGKVREDVLEVTKQRSLEFWQTSEKTPFKTNEEGEATIQVVTGKYWIAGLVEVEKKKIIWDVPIEIIRSKYEAEINNQNATDIRNPETHERVVAVLSGQIPEKVAEEKSEEEER